MRFQEPTKWEDFLDGFHNFWNCLDAYNDDSYWGRKEFWEWINLGFYREYIYDYDYQFTTTISKERQLRLAEKPKTIYVSQEAYDKLVEAINKPPEYDENIARVLSRKAPWDEEND